MTTLLYVLAVLMISGVVYWLIVKRHFDVCSFYMFTHLFLFLPAPILIAVGLESSDPNPFLQLINYDAALMLQGLIFVLHFVGLLGGFLLLARTGIGSSILPYFGETRSDKMTMIGLVVLTLINFAVILMPLLKAGSILGAVYLIRNEFFFSGFNFLRIFLVVGVFLCAAQFAQMLRQRKEGHYLTSNIVFAGFLFFLNLVLTAFLGGKGFVAFPMIFFVLSLYAGQLHKRLGLVIILLAAFLGFVTLLQQARVVLVQDNTSLSAWDYAYTGLRFRLFEDNMVYLGGDGDLHKTETGEDFINGLLGPVPRSIWPGKPPEITAGARFKRQLMPNSGGGWPPYGFNQWFLNFGWLGVLIGGFLTGALLQSLNQVYRDYQTNAYSFIIMMMFFIRLLMPGGIDNLFLVEYIFFILPLFIFKVLTEKGVYAFPATKTIKTP